MKTGTGVLSVGITAKGRGELIAHQQGRKLPRAAAIKAKCYDCMAGYADGKVDCILTRCPLYSFMPYGKIDSKTANTPETTPASKSKPLEVGA